MHSHRVLRRLIVPHLPASRSIVPPGRELIAARSGNRTSGPGMGDLTERNCGIESGKRSEAHKRPVPHFVPVVRTAPARRAYPRPRILDNRIRPLCTSEPHRYRSARPVRRSDPRANRVGWSIGWRLVRSEPGRDSTMVRAGTSSTLRVRVRTVRALGGRTCRGRRCLHRRVHTVARGVDVRVCSARSSSPAGIHGRLRSRQRCRFGGVDLRGCRGGNHGLFDLRFFGPGCRFGRGGDCCCGAGSTTGGENPCDGVAFGVGHPQPVLGFDLDLSSDVRASILVIGW